LVILAAFRGGLRGVRFSQSDNKKQSDA